MLQSSRDAAAYAPVCMCREHDSITSRRSAEAALRLAIAHSATREIPRRQYVVVQTRLRSSSNYWVCNFEKCMALLISREREASADCNSLPARLIRHATAGAGRDLELVPGRPSIRSHLFKGTSFKIEKKMG